MHARVRRRIAVLVLAWLASSAPAGAQSRERCLFQSHPEAGRRRGENRGACVQRLSAYGARIGRDLGPVPLSLWLGRVAGLASIYCNRAERNATPQQWAALNRCNPRERPRAAPPSASQRRVSAQLPSSARDPNWAAAALGAAGGSVATRGPGARGGQAGVALSPPPARRRTAAPPNPRVVSGTARVRPSLGSRLWAFVAPSVASTLRSMPVIGPFVTVAPAAYQVATRPAETRRSLDRRAERETQRQAELLRGEQTFRNRRRYARSTVEGTAAYVLARTLDPDSWRRQYHRAIGDFELHEWRRANPGRQPPRELLMRTALTQMDQTRAPRAAGRFVWSIAEGVWGHVKGAATGGWRCATQGNGWECGRALENLFMVGLDASGVGALRTGAVRGALRNAAPDAGDAAAAERALAQRAAREEPGARDAAPGTSSPRPAARASVAAPAAAARPAAPPRTGRAAAARADDGPAPPAAIAAVEEQAAIAGRVAAAAPARQLFVKDAPIYGYRIGPEARSFDDLPEPIRRHLGGVDDVPRAEYEAFFQRNQGNVIVLQMDGARPDFYIVPRDTFASRYADVPLEQVATRNARLNERLQGVEGMSGLLGRDPNLIGGLRTTPTEMVRMSDSGYPVGQPVTIRTHFGTQTKPAGQDAFLVRETGDFGSRYYMVNVGEDGLPSGYMPHRPAAPVAAAAEAPRAPGARRPPERSPEGPGGRAPAAARPDAPRPAAAAAAARPGIGERLRSLLGSRRAPPLNGEAMARLGVALRRRNVDPRATHIPEFAEFVGDHLARARAAVRRNGADAEDLSTLARFEAEAARRVAESGVTYQWWYEFNYRLSILMTPAARRGGLSSSFRENLLRTQAWRSEEGFRRAAEPYAGRFDLMEKVDAASAFPRDILIPTFRGELDVDELNAMYGTGLHPIGMIDRAKFADNRTMQPDDFFNHDGAHAIGNMDARARLPAGWAGSLRANYQAHRASLPANRREVFDRAYFMLTHEGDNVLGLLYPESWQGMGHVPDFVKNRALAEAPAWARRSPDGARRYFQPFERELDAFAARYYPLPPGAVRAAPAAPRVDTLLTP